VFINNQMACRQGDIVVEKPGLALGPMNPILMGCPTVLIGESGAASGGGGAPSLQTMVSIAALKDAAISGVALVGICPE
jgi:hypothetical protein